ncbi:hypothetical protein B0H13DRAFT_2534177 [Mycena leptocephala]|nr:hypothetical protein B0H13DRAFT_2534177 [Mycena leptocephala]
MHALIVELGGFFGALASLWCVYREERTDRPGEKKSLGLRLCLGRPNARCVHSSALLVGGLGTGRCIWPVGVPSDSKTAMGISYVVAQGATCDTSPQRSRGPPNIPTYHGGACAVSVAAQGAGSMRIHIVNQDVNFVVIDLEGLSSNNLLIRRASLDALPQSFRPEVVGAEDSTSDTPSLSPSHDLEEHPSLPRRTSQIPRFQRQRARVEWSIPVGIPTWDAEGDGTEGNPDGDTHNGTAHPPPRARA